ncbi:MAG: acyltransferase [bacterium]
MLPKTQWVEYRNKVKLGFLKSVYRKSIQLFARFAYFNSLRILLYRMMGVKIGRKVYIGFDCYIDPDFSELITIEDDVIISFRVIIVAHDRKREYAAPIEIKSEAFLGAGAIALPGVVIGSKSVVGAGAVVSRDVPDGATVVGNPAQIVKSSSEK